MADADANAFQQPPEPVPAPGSLGVGGGQRGCDLPAGLPKPARRALVDAGRSQLEQLTRLSETEVKGLHGVGPEALGQLRRALEANGRSFADGKAAS